MRGVSIIGTGMTPVGEHWAESLRSLAAQAGQAAMKNAGIDESDIDALYIGNAYGSTFNEQSHTGALIADFMQLDGIEAYRCEAGDASGAVALRNAYLAIASGAVDVALVIGVEKSTDIVGNARLDARGISLDADYESLHGATLTSMAALLMQRYMHEYDVPLSVFEGFSINAHRNGKKNPFAMYRNTLRAGSFSRAPVLATPVNLFDSAPDADGAAALVLVASDNAPELVSLPVEIVGSAVATDRFMLSERADMLYLRASALSAERALKEANLESDAIDFFELHDAYTILSTLSLEAAGFAEKGQGWRLAADEGYNISSDGQLPISIAGGLKSRGNPAGAAGIYQAVEATLQLQNKADENQLNNPKIGMIQNLGGLASTAVTHILRVNES